MACLCLTFVFARAAVGPVLLARPPVDELTWVDRALMPQWVPRITGPSDEAEPLKRFGKQYYYAIHHPTLVRVVYRWVLHRGGYYEAPKREYDYSLGYEENLARGNYLPDPMRARLRFTNALFVWAAVMLFYFGLLRISGRPVLAALALLPVACEPALVNGLNCAVGYIGTDAILLFMTALFWLAWLHVKDAGFAGIALLGVLSGLAASTKYNGALVLIAAMLYYLVCARGWRRYAWPLVLGAIAVAVFAALNPVYTAGSLSWPWRVLRDTVGILSRMQAAAAGSGDYISSRAELTLALFPYIPFALPIAAVLADVRRAWWFAPTAAWSLLIIAGNLAVIMVFLPTYAAPVRVALMVLLAAAALTRINGILRGETGTPAACDEVVQPLQAGVGDAPAADAAGEPRTASAKRVVMACAAVAIMAAAGIVTGHFPVPVFSAALVLAAVIGCAMILEGAVATAAVVLPLSFVLPWHGQQDAASTVMPMVAFSAAGATIWLLLLGAARRRRPDVTVTLAAVVSSVAAALSPCSAALLLVATAVLSVRRGAPARKAVAAALLAPAAIVLAAQWAFARESFPRWREFVALGPAVWNSKALLEGAHGLLYCHMVFKYGQPFYLMVAGVMCVFAWPLRRKWWFAPTMGAAAVLIAGTYLYGGDVYYQWSIPLQTAILIPSGIIAVETLRANFGKRTGAAAN